MLNLKSMRNDDRTNQITRVNKKIFTIKWQMEYCSFIITKNFKRVNECRSNRQRKMGHQYYKKDKQT